MSSFLVALKRLREDRAPAVGLGLLVFVTALVFGAAPRLLDRIGDEALRGVGVRADGRGGNSAIAGDAPIPAGTPESPLVYVDEAGDRNEAMLPETVRDVIGGRS